MKLTPEQRRALTMIADARSSGATHAILQDRFKLQVIVDLISAGLASPRIETLKAGGRAQITDAGRQALAENMGT